MVVSMLTAVLSATFVACAPPAGAADAGPAHGLVGSFCDPARVTADRGAGVAVVVFGARWDLMFPARGAADPRYRTAVGDALRTCAAGGLRVVVDAGVQYVPAWARRLSGAALRDQYGDPPATGQLDVVFSANVRTAVAEYLRELVADLPPGTVEAVRVGTSTSGEIGLPGGIDGGRGHTDSWWAFGSAPQSGSGLAAGQLRSPLPGWVPGQPRWSGRSVTPADAYTWFRWYERSVAQAQMWLAWTVRQSGFNGAIHLPVPGRGVLPATLAAAVGTLLAGAPGRDDAFSRGQDYTDQMPLFGGALPGAVIDLTSVDDATAVRARAAVPPQDDCTFADANAVTDPATPVEQWSNLRYARAWVARAGLGVVGENPGPPGPNTGGVAGSDPEPEQLRRAPAYARSCALAALLFAFEDDLYSGTSGITADDYRTAW